MAHADDLQFFETKRGVKLHERRSTVKGKRLKALLVLCHGYGHHIDHHGHGYSEGLRCYVADYKHLVDDFCDYVESLIQEFPNVPVFVQGQSMGGAVALLSTTANARLEGKVRGVVFLCPMCRITARMHPPEWLIVIGEYLAWLFPTLPVAPVPSTIELAFKDKDALARAIADPLGYQQKPRLMTAMQMRAATMAVQEELARYKTPFAVMHGDADAVTDLESSKALHELAKSPVKELHVYPGMYHALLSEPDGGAEKVIADIQAFVLSQLKKHVVAV